MRASARVLAFLLAICLLTPIGALAASGQLTPKAGSSWQAQRSFAFDWDPVAPTNPTEAVFRVYDSHGALAIGYRQPVSLLLLPVVVPPVPDAYTLEAWLENEAGQSGAHSTGTLRFDNVAPPLPGLTVPSGWVRGTDPAIVHIDPPTEPAPLSGLDGFAISIDRGAGSSPCTQTNSCLAGDLDLTGAGGGDISLGTLPEGVHFVRAVTVSGSGVPSGMASAAVRVDASGPLVSLDGAPAGWSSRPVQVAARAADALSGMAASGPLGPFTAIAVDGGAPARAVGDTASAWVAGNGSHQVELLARDAAGNLGAGTAVIRIDEGPPRVAFAAAQDPAEPERIEATVSDPLSGPSPDRGSIGIRLASTRARFEPLPTRNVGDRLIAHWDSDSYPPGKYELIATGYDTAGNSAIGTDRARGGHMVLVNPLKAQVELTAGLSGRRFAGRLRRTGAGPLASQDVVVIETFAPGSEPRQRTTVVASDRQGTFALRLRRGPSRDVVARFAGTPLLSRSTSQAFHLKTATRVRLRSSAPAARVGGKPIVFSGTVGRQRTAANAIAGLPIELQFRFRGGAWSEFRTVEADARGNFRYRYRFSDDDSRGIRFQFRAYVKGREGWPYGPGTSRPVQITGR